MENRRQFLALMLTASLFVVWMQVAPLLFPDVFRRPQPPKAPPAEAAAHPAERDEAVATASAAPPGPTPPAELSRFPRRTLVLGDRQHGYLQRLQLDSRGAAIDWQELTEPQYTTLDRTAPLKLLGNSSLAGPMRTFVVDSPAFDTQLKAHGTSLATVDWEFVESESQRIPDSEAWSRIVFRYPSPDGAWEAIKTFALKPATDIDPKVHPGGYLLEANLQFRKLQAGAAQLTYSLQGPAGIPLEDAEDTRVFRSVKAGTLKTSNQDSVSLVSLTAAELVKQVNQAEANQNPGQRPLWRYPVRWAGVDMQYFAALVIPQEDQAPGADGDPQSHSYFAEIVPEVLQEDKLHPERSDVSLVFKSRPLTFGEEAGSSVEHRFQIYLGPKRVQLLDTFHAESVMDFGWFAWIARGMVGLLNFFHNVIGVPYGLAIVLLTVIVRGAMFPLSKKQVANVQKMKDLNPKLKELQEKYGQDKEALARAQWEFMKKHGYNPLAGCLPLFLQLPIFIGLYQGISGAVDLRLAKFLWINNLAAPDALFPLPFQVPWFGWTQFNLLPILTVALFIVQNKLFTPPPTNEEQAMQYKMMNVMMGVMGVMFYRVPAGLCVYFIASSLWGIAERKLLDRHKLQLEAAAAAGRSPGRPEDEGGGGARPEPAPEPREPGLLARLLEAADRAREQTSGRNSPSRETPASKRPKSRR